ncbi:unnamed protein product [Urochloa decumbens]|uniref:Uncharacterized protein n=1 Tax=Urochloa decumbens TaxID=240449 RepID=A0ABC9A407_9POAL
MSNMLVLDLYNMMVAGNSSSSHHENENDYQELVPRMSTIKPAYRWAIRGFFIVCAIVIAIGNVTAEEDISVKIVAVIVMVLLVWFIFVATSDALVYRVQQGAESAQESMV